MNNLGNYTKNTLRFLLSVLFEREDFSYGKILSIHQNEIPKIKGVLRQKEPFLYLVPYRAYIRKLLWSIKFRNNQYACIHLGRLLYEVLPEHLIEWEQFKNFNNPLLVCVPSSKQSLRVRGFNQNHLIIKKFLNFGGNSFLTYAPKVILKIKNTPKQSRVKTREERLENPKGAFAIANAHLSLIKSRNIILFDDVLTTGATTQEIVRILKKAGASQIKIIVIAH